MKKIPLMCKYYVHGFECIWELRDKPCNRYHTEVVKAAYDEYRKAVDQGKGFGIA